MAVDPVELPGVRQPRSTPPHDPRPFEPAAGKDASARERPWPAPEEPAVACEDAPEHRRTADLKNATAHVEQFGPELQRPPAVVRVGIEHCDPALLRDPVPAFVRDPVDMLGEAGAVEGLELPMHEASDVREVHVSVALGPVHVRAAAPEVLPGQVRDRHRQALMPAVIVRSIVGDHAAAERAERMEEGSRAFERIECGTVAVLEQLRELGLMRAGDVGAVAAPRVAEIRVRSRGDGPVLFPVAVQVLDLDARVGEVEALVALLAR